MSTIGKLIFRFEVIVAGATGANSKIDFNDGSDRVATVAAGVYTPDELAAAIVTALEAANPTPVWACSFSHSTGKFTISSDGAFTLLWATGANVGADMHKLLGFDVVNQASVGNACVADTAIPTTITDGYPVQWTLADPHEYHTPVTAQASGATLARGQRRIRAVQNIADGGLADTIFFSRDKLIEISFRWLTDAEATKMEAFLDWIERGRRFIWYPDSSDLTKFVELVAADLTQVVPAFEWLARTEITYGRLLFLEQTSRT